MDSLRQAGVHEADYTAICKKIAEGGITAGTQTLVFRLRHSIEGPDSSPECESFARPRRSRPRHSSRPCACSLSLANTTLIESNVLQIYIDPEPQMKGYGLKNA